MVDIMTLHLGVPIVIGLIIGIVEAYFVYSDEGMASGRDMLKDLWHGLTFCVIGVLVVMNVPFLLSLVNLPGFVETLLFVDENGISLTMSILVSIIMYLKMVASHAVRGVGARGFKEKAWHKLLIAALVGFAPYYIFPILPGIQETLSFLPTWLL